MDRIDAVTKADIRRVANQVFLRRREDSGRHKKRHGTEVRNEEGFWVYSSFAADSLLHVREFTFCTRVEQNTDTAAARVPSPGAETDRASELQSYFLQEIDELPLIDGVARIRAVLALRAGRKGRTGLAIRGSVAHGRQCASADR